MRILFSFYGPYEARGHFEPLAPLARAAIAAGHSVAFAGEPPMVAMVASGESSGNLAEALDHVATDQQRSLDAWVKAVIGLVEPAILLVMGGLVMAMVLAILLPIISMNGLVGQ